MLEYNSMQLESIIGLEIHVQLKTKSKMFCACDNTGENQSANTTICPVCMGHPGTLPVPNAMAVEMGARAAMALHLRVNIYSKFDRKNYFYPDLPKGYQISQFDKPIAQEGYLDIVVGEVVRRIGIERLHLEEDTAKLLHVVGGSLVDFNRSGTPLAEIVTKPEIKTPEEARIFLQELRLIMRYLGVADADMEKGHLRCDANISLRPVGDAKLYPKTEVKNINSFRSVERALLFEIKRQTELWKADSVPTETSTRGWDEKTGVTSLQRTKEGLHDYRYFPEPDIPPVVLTEEQVEVWRASLPELPAERRARFISDYEVSAKDAQLLTEDKVLGDFVEQVISKLSPELEGDIQASAKLATSWTINKLGEILHERGSDVSRLAFDAEAFVEFLLLVARRQVNSTNAQVVLRKMVETGKNAADILAKENLGQVDDADVLTTAIERVIVKYPQQVDEYKGGKEPVIKFLLGAVMKETKGKVDPLTAETILRNSLK